MARNDLLPININVKRSSWRMLDGHASEHDKNFAPIRQQVLTRDNYTCRFCGFRSPPNKNDSSWQEVHHLDDDHSNNNLTNLATACCLCHQCFHIGLAGSANGGTMIWLPEISQAQLNNIMRAVFVAVKSDSIYSRNALALTAALEARALYIEQEFAAGAANPSFFGQALLNVPPDKINQDVMAGVRLLPNITRFNVQVDFWMAGMMGEGEAKEYRGAFAALHPDTWESIAPPLEPEEVEEPVAQEVIQPVATDSTEEDTFLPPAEESSAQPVTQAETAPESITESTQESFTDLEQPIITGIHVEAPGPTEPNPIDMSFLDEIDAAMAAEGVGPDYQSASAGGGWSLYNHEVDGADAPIQVFEPIEIESAHDIVPLEADYSIASGRIYLPIDAERAERALELGALEADNGRLYLDLADHDVDRKWRDLDGMLPFYAHRQIIPLHCDQIPETSIASSLSGLLTKQSWVALSDSAIADHGGLCAICGQAGHGTIDAHEVWEYHEPKSYSVMGIQRLVDIIPVCNPCHEMFHMESAKSQGVIDRATARLMMINRWTEDDLAAYMQWQSRTYLQRSKYCWVMDLSAYAGANIIINDKWTYDIDDMLLKSEADISLVIGAEFAVDGHEGTLEFDPGWFIDRLDLADESGDQASANNETSQEEGTE